MFPVKDYISHEYTISKSRFIAYIFRSDNEKDILSCVAYLRDEHKRAKQICYVYKISSPVCKIKTFNDTEPKGIVNTAILSLIEKFNLDNIAIIVVRYFGGIKLGKSGLYCAYSKVSKQCIESYLNNK